MRWANSRALHPAAGSFQRYGDLYLSEWAGFLSGAGYWAAIAISIGAEMVASATYMAFWFPSVPGIAWVIAASLLLLAVNRLSVRRLRPVRVLVRDDQGRGHRGLHRSSVSRCCVSGRTVPQYTAHGGLFPNGALATLLALPFALYTFAGVEFVAVASGESRSNAEVARATRLTFAILASSTLARSSC